MALRKELSCPFCDGGLTCELEATKAAKKDKTAKNISFSNATIDALHPRCRGGQYVKENVVLVSANVPLHLDATSTHARTVLVACRHRSAVTGATTSRLGFPPIMHACS